MNRKKQKSEVSPFEYKWIKVNKGGGNGEVQEFVSTQTGEVVSLMQKEVVSISDGLPYVKLSRAFAVEVIAAGKLGKSGMMVFAAIVRVMLRHKEHFFLTYEMFESVTDGAKVSRVMFHKGIGELIDAGVIARGMASNFYWLNTNYFFKGDRVKMIKDKRWGDGMFNS
jgi:hypothetical protein